MRRERIAPGDGGADRIVTAPVPADGRESVGCSPS